MSITPNSSGTGICDNDAGSSGCKKLSLFNELHFKLESSIDALVFISLRRRRLRQRTLLIIFPTMGSPTEQHDDDPTQTFNKQTKETDRQTKTYH